MSEEWVTKKDLPAAIAPLASNEELARAVARMVSKQDLVDAIRQSEERIVDKVTAAIRDSQTEVLRAFYNLARPVEIRLNRIDEIATRLSWIEERTAALERGKFPTSH